MNAERLAELQRQRDLVRAHLAWLEREIEALGAASAPAPATHRAAVESATKPGERTPTPPLSAPEAGLVPAPEFAAKLASDTAVSHYQPDPGAAARDARRGCLLAATVGLLLLLGALAALYLAYYRDRPLFFPREAAPVEKVPR